MNATTNGAVLDRPSPPIAPPEPQRRRNVRLWLFAYLLGNGFLWFALHHLIGNGHGTGTLAPLEDVWASALRPFGLSFRYPGEWFISRQMLVPAVLIADLVYLGALFALRRQEISIRELCVWAAVAGLPFVIGPRFQSNDISEYLLRARMLFVHHLNPYLYPAKFAAFDAYFPTTRWHEVRWIYGPVFLLFTAPFSLPSTPVVGFVLIRAATLALHITNGYLLWKVSFRQPRRRLFAAAAYLLAPLLLIESAGNAHNDFLLISFVLLGLLNARLGRTAWASAALGGALLVKIYALPILGCFVLSHARRPLREFACAALPATLLIVTFYFPFWTGPDMIRAIFDGGSSRNLVNSLLKAVNSTTGLPELTLVKAGLVITTVTLLAGLLVSYRRQRWEIPAAYAMFFWCTVGSGWFWPWYVATPAVLALVSGDRPLRWAALALLVTTIAIYMDVWSYAYAAGRDLVWLTTFLVPIGVLLLARWLGDESLTGRLAREWSVPDRRVGPPTLAVASPLSDDRSTPGLRADL